MIVSISYLVSESERVHVRAQPSGKFMLKRKRKNRYSTSPGSSTKTYYAKDFVEYMKLRDPYITLENGTKMRVYRGGNSSDEVIETICIIESHDEKAKKRVGKVLIPPHDYPDSDYLGW
tara:strand:+ start:4653 stop:5009 length:357 start_codon:yes stop_codon:yes gene_type:complete